MPHRILHVLRIDRLVQLELLAPLLEHPRVITGDAALPVLRRLRRRQFEELVEVRHRLLEMPRLEMLRAAMLIDQRRLGIQFDDLIEIRDGPRVIAHGLEKLSAHRVALGVLGIRGDGLVREHHGLRAFALLESRLGCL